MMDKTILRTFLGMTGYYQNFIMYFFDISAAFKSQAPEKNAPTRKKNDWSFQIA